MPLYLTFKEIWRNRGRFLIFNMVIALITMLVLFVAALGSGLANANRQLIDKIDAELLAVQDNADLSLTASRLDETTLKDIRRINGVVSAGPIGLSSAALVVSSEEKVDISLIGVDPNQVGAPSLLSGSGLRNMRADQVVIDEKLAKKYNYALGGKITIRSVQGTEEELFSLTIVGITEEQQYFFQPSIFVPLNTWDEIRPQANPAARPSRPIFNVVAVKLDPSMDAAVISQRISTLVDKIEISDKESVIRAQPGYMEQQATINSQAGFALFIGMLVLGGFFQIQTLQKVPQIGMLKAIGASNRTVALAVFSQVIFVTLIGVLMGTLLTFGLALGIPSNVPIRFTPQAVGLALASLLAIAPLGGIFSIRMATKVEPLIAMGL